jgi:hypothetical protein
VIVGLAVGCRGESELPLWIHTHCHQTEIGLELAVAQLAKGSATSIIALGDLHERSTISFHLIAESSFCSEVRADRAESERLHDELAVKLERYVGVPADDLTGQGSALRDVAQLFQRIDAMPLAR